MKHLKSVKNFAKLVDSQKLEREWHYLACTLWGWAWGKTADEAVQKLDKSSGKNEQIIILSRTCEEVQGIKFYRPRVDDENNLEVLAVNISYFEKEVPMRMLYRQADYPLGFIDKNGLCIVASMPIEIEKD